jgi:hypothetical protein
MKSIEKFIKDIRKFESANVFNPYRDICPAHDDENSAEIRSENLALLLEAALRFKVKTI